MIFLKKKEKITFLSIYLTAGFVLFSSVALAKETTINNEDLHARSAVLMDADSGRILFSKNGEEVLPMASTTKIMTLILALENAKPDEIVTVSGYAASMPDVQLNIKKDEKYVLKDLEYSMMLESHNDSAVAIAEHIGGSVEQFADMMNQKAVEIGCCNTYFITPNGLDASRQDKIHSTTAEDLARIMRYCIKLSPKKEEFLKITQTDSYRFENITQGSKAGQRRCFSCHNHNALLNMMAGAVSGKTGFTGDAGYCYVGAVTKADKNFVFAILACGWPGHKTWKWSDSKKLIAYGDASFSVRKVSEITYDQNLMNPLPVTNGQTEKIGEKAYVHLKQKIVKECDSDIILLKENEHIKVRYEKKRMLAAPVIKNQKVGKIQFVAGDQIYKELDILTNETIEKIDYLWCVKRIMDKFLLL